MGGFFHNLGRKVGAGVRKANWVVSSLTGSEDEVLQAEHAVGRDMARGIAEQMFVDTTPDVQRYLDDIGDVLIRCVRDQRLRFCYRVLRAAEVNAFALPGGFIFVTRPLLELCQWNQDEIAFVLGHEMGHVIQRHALDRLMASSLLRSGLGRLPIGGLVGGTVLNVAMTLLQQGYSREQELEADQIGVQLIHCGGFDSRAAARLLMRLQEMPQETWLGSSYFASHPPVLSRIEHINRLLAEKH
ncbi:MAG: M48 family metalloprotease [Gemmataceae bacterium]